MLNNISEFEVEVKRFIELHITFDLAHMYVCPEQALFPEYIQRKTYTFPVDTGGKLNVHKTFNLRPVSIGLSH